MPGYPVSEPGVSRGARSQTWQYTLGSVTVGTATSVANSSATASVVVNKPTVVDNTLLVASIGLGNASINSVPSGWALLPGSASGTGGAGGALYVFGVYYKYIASASGEAATTYTWGLSASVKNSGIIVPFYGVHTGTQFDTNSITQSLASATVASTFNSATTAVRAGGMLIGGLITGTDGGTVLDPPSGWTEITEVAGIENAVGYKTAAHDIGFNASVLATYTRHDAGTAAHAWSIGLRVDNAFTWTKPAWARRVRVVAITAGAGGGGSCKQATTSNRSGGGGGCGGYRGEFILDGPTLPATLAITVGRGGAGGSAAVVNTTTGGSGGAVEDCTVTGSGISGVTAVSSNANQGAGGGGSTAGGSGGSQTNTLAWTTREVGGQGGAGSITAAGATSAATAGPSSGGGAGGGFNSSNTAFDPGGAGATGIVATATLTNVGTAGTGDVPGAADPTGMTGGQGGAGGQANGAGNAGNGGTGGFPGGGGGGGGAAVNSTGNAGYGGRGGHGCVTVTAEG